MKKRTKIFGVALGIVAIMALLVAGVVFADTGEGTDIFPSETFCKQSGGQCSDGDSSNCQGADSGHCAENGEGECAGGAGAGFRGNCRNK